MGTTVWDLKFNADASQAKAEVAALGDTLTKSLKTMDMVGTSINANFEKSEKSMAMHSRQGQKELEAVGKTLQAPVTETPAVKSTLDDIVKFGGEGVKMANSMKRAWMMAFMSIMWFAYSIKRALEGFARSAIDTFMKVTDSSNELNRGFTYLSAVWEYFKFSFINAALGPVLMIILPIIIDIVDKFVEWMDTNPDMSKMLGYLTLIGIALATIVFWGSQIGLLVVGIIGLGIALAGLSFPALLVLAGTFIFIMEIIGVLIVIIGILYICWKNNIGGMQETVAGLWKYIKKYVGDILDMWSWLFKGIEDLMTGNTDAFYDDMQNMVKACSKSIP